jgi:hypothetical protein
MDSKNFIGKFSPDNWRYIAYKDTLDKLSSSDIDAIKFIIKNLPHALCQEHIEALCSNPAASSCIKDLTIDKHNIVNMCSVTNPKIISLIEEKYIDLINKECIDVLCRNESEAAIKLLEKLYNTKKELFNMQDLIKLLFVNPCAHKFIIENNLDKYLKLK